MLITRDPSISGGVPVFTGTRVPLRNVLASLAAGESTEAIVANYPTLTKDHVQAAIAFAASAAKEDLPPAPAPAEVTPSAA